MTLVAKRPLYFMKDHKTCSIDKRSDDTNRQVLHRKPRIPRRCDTDTQATAEFHARAGTRWTRSASAGGGVQHLAEAGVSPPLGIHAGHLRRPATPALSRPFSREANPSIRAVT
jgi:hypothetical protein